MLHAVHDRRFALTAQATKLSRPRAGNHGIRLLGDPTLEHAGALEDETPRLPGEPPGDALHADECGRAIWAVHHQVFHVALALDIAGECLRDSGSVSFGMSGPSLYGCSSPCFIANWAFAPFFMSLPPLSSVWDTVTPDIASADPVGPTSLARLHAAVRP